MSRRRLLLLSNLEPWSMAKGVGASSLHETLRGAVDAGWQIDYVTSEKHSLRKGASHEKNLAARIKGVREWRFPMKRLWFPLGSRIQGKFNRLFLFPQSAKRSLVDYLQQEKPDLIYAYEEGAIEAVHHIKRKIEAMPPVLNRYQGTILGEEYRKKSLCIRKYEIWRALCRPADLFVMTDDGTLGDHALRFWNKYVTENNLLFIRNGIDKSIYRPDSNRASALQEFGLDPKSFYLMTVSRLVGWKRIDRAIELLAGLGSMSPEVRLIVCGEGEARDSLECFANELGVLDRMHFLGGLPHEKIGVLMNTADLFLSLYDVSNCGNPLFEALACGRCILTLDNGGTGTVIRNGQNGRLLQPDDRGALVETTSQLIRSESLRNELGRGALEWASRNMMTWEKRMAQEFEWIDRHLYDR